MYTPVAQRGTQTTTGYVPISRRIAAGYISVGQRGQKSSRFSLQPTTNLLTEFGIPSVAKVSAGGAEPLISGIAKGALEIGKFAYAIPQFGAREVISLGLSTPLGKKVVPEGEIIPEEELGKFGTKLIGEEPILAKGERFKELGVGAKEIGIPRGLAPVVVGFVTAGEAALNLWFGGGGKAAFEKFASKIVKEKNVEVIIQDLLKKGVAEDVARTYAPKLAAATEIKVVKEGLDKMAKLQLETKAYVPVRARQGLEPLAQEARKYKSAEDFIESVRQETIKKTETRPEQLKSYLESAKDIPENKLANETPRFTKGIITPARPVSQEMKLATEEFKKMKVFQQIKEPDKLLPVIRLPDEISSIIKADNPEVTITRRALKHIVERRDIVADEFVNAIPDVLSNPSKIADNTAKTPDSYLFAKMNGKAKGVVLEVKKTPKGNRVVSAFPIDRKTYGKIKDISGRAEFPPFELAKGKNYQQILSDVRNINKPSIAQRLSTSKGGAELEVKRPPSLKKLGLTPEERLITRKESVLLRQRIRDEARGARTGFETGRRLTREELINQFRQSVVRMDELKKNLIGYIRANLPREAQGKFIQALGPELSRKRAFSIMERVTQESERIEKSKIIGEIKEMKIPKRGEPDIAVDYQKKIAGLFAPLDFSKPTEATIKKLGSLKEYLANNQEVLRLHPELLQKVERLSKKNLRDMTAIELTELKDTISHLHELGELKVILKNKYNARARETNLNRLLDSTRNIDPKIKNPAKMTDFEKTAVETKKIYMNTIHAPRVADMIDGYKGYTGANATISKKFTWAETAAQENQKALVGQTLEDIQRLGVDEVTEDAQLRITLKLMEDQGAMDQVGVLLEKNNLTAIPALSEIEEKVVNLVRERVGIHTDQIATLYEELENVPFQKVKNYWPIKYENEFNIVPSELIQQGRFRTAKVERGFTKARVKGVERVPRTDFLAVFEEAIGDQQWYLNLQPELENARQLVFSKEYFEKGGNLAVNFWKDYIDVVARRGWSATARSSYFLRKGRLNLNDAVLGYKASTIMLQPFALFDAMAYAQTRYGAKATYEVAKEFTKAWLVPGVAKRTIAESAALRVRAGGEVAIQESLERVAKDKLGGGLASVYNGFKRGAMKAIQFADVRTAAGTQNGILNTLEKNGVANAKQEAEFLMNIMQGSAEVTYRPLILSKGEGARTWFTFQTFMLNRWGIVAHDIIRSGFKGNWKAKLNATLGLGILIAGAIAEDEARDALFSIISGKEKEEKRSALASAVMFIPEQVPYFGNILSSLTQFGDASGAPPVVRIVEDTFQGGYQVFTAKKPETKIKGGIKFGKGIAGLGFGVPGTFQIADIVKRLFQTETKTKGIEGLPELPKLPELPTLPRLPSLPGI